MNAVKFLVIGMSLLIAALTAAVLYGMVHPPGQTRVPGTPLALNLPVTDLTVLPPAGGYMALETRQNGRQTIYLVDPATLTIHGTISPALAQ